MTIKSSYELANGVCGLTDGLYGRGVPSGLSGRIPFCLSRKETGGAKSAGLIVKASSVNLAGVGSELNGAGGALGFIGGGKRPLMDDMPRGGMKRPDEAAELLPEKLPGPRGPVLLRKRGGARGGGVMARRVTGSAYGALGWVTTKAPLSGSKMAPSRYSEL